LAAIQQHRAPPTQTIDAQNLAKGHRTAGERAYLAAKWITGGLVIDKPTASLAATIFGCSQGSVGRALAELGGGGDVAVGLAQLAWDRMTPKQRDMFVRANLLPVWDSVERITR
jgi:hypothetical protein